MLTFSPANAKTRRLHKVKALRPYLQGGCKVYSLDLLSGWSCPFAKDCLSKAYKTINGLRIQDGPETKFRCFSASTEVQYPGVYKKRKANFEAIKACKTRGKILDLLHSSLPKNAGIIRYHVAGDFFNYKYFISAVNLANQRPDVLFYAYTKALGAWTSVLETRGKLPSNLVLTASYGGTLDNLIKPYGLRSARVVFSQYQARKLGLPIDHDDSHAANPDCGSFALLLHGTQPAKTEASKAWQRIKTTAGGYGG